MTLYEDYFFLALLFQRNCFYCVYILAFFYSSAGIQLIFRPKAYGHYATFAARLGAYTWCCCSQGMPCI